MLAQRHSLNTMALNMKRVNYYCRNRFGNAGTTNECTPQIDFPWQNDLWKN